MHEHSDAIAVEAVVSSAGRLLEELAFAFVAYYEVFGVEPRWNHGARLVLLAGRLRSGESRSGFLWRNVCSKIFTMLSTIFMLSSWCLACVVYRLTFFYLCHNAVLFLVYRRLCAITLILTSEKSYLASEYGVESRCPRLLTSLHVKVYLVLRATMSSQGQQMRNQKHRSRVGEQKNRIVNAQTCDFFSQQ